MFFEATIDMLCLMKKIIITIIATVAFTALAVTSWWYFTKQPSSDHQKPSVAYLNIKELGIKIRLPNELNDAQYYYDASKSTPDRQIVEVYTKTLSDISHGECDPHNKLASPPFGLLIKTKNPGAPGPGSDSTLQPNGKNIFKFGEYYVYTLTPDTACSADKDVQTVAAKQLQAFLEAFKTMTLDE